MKRCLRIGEALRTNVAQKGTKCSHTRECQRSTHAGGGGSCAPQSSGAVTATNEQIILPGFNYAFDTFDAAFSSAVLGIEEGEGRDDVYRKGRREGNDTRSPQSLPGGTLAARLLYHIYSIKQRGQSNTAKHGDKTKTDWFITMREARSDSGGGGGGIPYEGHSL